MLREQQQQQQQKETNDYYYSTFENALKSKTTEYIILEG